MFICSIPSVARCGTPLVFAANDHGRKNTEKYFALSSAALDGEGSGTPSRTGTYGTLRREITESEHCLAFCLYYPRDPDTCRDEPIFNLLIVRLAYYIFYFCYTPNSIVTRDGSRFCEQSAGCKRVSFPTRCCFHVGVLFVGFASRS